ncbi:MAG: MFS transporter [Oligoflexia bacterium]|nr:MFS transporter [Oligoflexia bacterium]
MDRTIGSNFVIFLTDYHKFTPLQSSLIFAVFSLVVCLIDFPLGNIADIYGRKKILILGFASYSLGMLIFGLANSILYFIIGAVLEAIGMALISGVPVSWYYDEVKAEQKEGESLNVFALQKWWGHLLLLLTGPLVGILINYNPNATFICSSMFGFISIVLISVVMKENYGEIKDEKRDARSSWNLFKQNITSLKKNQKFIDYVIADIGEIVYFFGFIFIWQQVYLASGFSKVNIGFVYTAMIFLTGLGGGVLALKQIKKLPLEKVYFISGVGVVVGLVLCSLASFNSWFFLGGAVIFEFCLGTVLTINNEITNRIVDKESRTAFLSAISSIAGLFTTITYVMHGLFSEKLSFGVIFIICAVAAIVSLSKKHSILLITTKSAITINFSDK